MAVRCLNLLCIVTLFVFTFGFNLHRLQESFQQPKENSVNETLNDLLHVLMNKNLSVIPLMEPNLLRLLDSDLKASLDKVADLDNILDKYPDHINKTFSKVEEKDGKTIVTNTTVFKDKSNSSLSEVYIQEQTIDGKKSFLDAELRLPVKGLDLNDTDEEP